MKKESSLRVARYAIIAIAAIAIAGLIAFTVESMRNRHHYYKMFEDENVIYERCSCGSERIIVKQPDNTK